MKVSMIKVKTPSIPSRTAAAQFIDVHGYDIEWVPLQQLFYIHDLEKNHLHAVHMAEVTNFKLDVADPAAFLKELRSGPLSDLFAASITSQGDVRIKAKPSKKAEQQPASA
jgi:hypothetical protein